MCDLTDFVHFLWKVYNMSSKYFAAFPAMRIQPNSTELKNTEVVATSLILMGPSEFTQNYKGSNPSKAFCWESLIKKDKNVRLSKMCDLFDFDGTSSTCLLLWGD